jgi:hypothetical protein
MTVVTDPMVDKPAILLTITGAPKVANFVRLIETPAIDLEGTMSHGCAGFHHIRLFRKGRLVAEFSFDHTSLLRPYSENLWKGGDVEVTESSARALASWFKEHGLPESQKEIDDTDEERARWEAFHEVFSPTVREFLKKVRLPIWDRTDLPTNCPAASVELLSAAVPDPSERARLLFVALGNLRGDWSSYDDEGGTVLVWAHCLPVEILVSTISELKDDEVAVRGAARVFFGSYPGGTGLIRRLGPDVAARLAAVLASPIFLENDAKNAPLLPQLLSDFRTKEVDDVLRAAAARTDAPRDEACGDLDRASVPLSALVVLSERRRADSDLLHLLSKREWRCRANRAAVRTADALADERLPKADEVAGADATTVLMLLRRLKEHTTKDAVDLAFAGLLENRWGVARGAVEEWLSDLSKVQPPAKEGITYGEYTREYHARLHSWWTQARPNWNDAARTP